jgi:hypothetical protein
MMDGFGNGQRALWTFLFYTLVGPFIGAMLIALVGPLAGLAGFFPETAARGVGGFLSATAWTAMFAYVWAAPAAALAAIGLLPFVFRNGAFGWIAAAVAGVIAFAIIAVLFTLPEARLVPYLAFLAGVVSILCRWVLVRFGVLLT